MLRASLLVALCATVSCFVVPPCSRQEQLGSDGKEGFYSEGAVGPNMQCAYRTSGCVIFNKEKNEKMYVPFGEYADTGSEMGFRKRCYTEKKGTTTTYGTKFEGCIVSSQLVAINSVAKVGQLTYNCSCTERSCSIEISYEGEVTQKPTTRAPTCNTEPKILSPESYSVEEMSGGRCWDNYGCVHTAKDGKKTLIPASESRDTATHFGFRTHCSILMDIADGIRLYYEGCMINGELIKIGDKFVDREVVYQCLENEFKTVPTVPTTLPTVTCSDEKEIYAGVLYRFEKLNTTTNKCEKVVAGCVYTDKRTSRIFHIPLGEYIDTDTRHGYRMQCTHKPAKGFGTYHIGCVINSEFFKIGETRDDHSEGMTFRCERGILRPVAEIEVTPTPRPANPSGLCTYIDQETRQEKRIPFGETFDTNPTMGHRLECFKEGNVSGTRSVACIFGGKAYQVGERGEVDIGFAKLLVECAANFTHHVVKIL